MNFRALSIALACAAGLAIGLSQAQDYGVTWLGDYQEALKVARETGKPIFVEFRCEA